MVKRKNPRMLERNSERMEERTINIFCQLFIYAESFSITYSKIFSALERVALHKFQRQQLRSWKLRI